MIIVKVKVFVADEKHFDDMGVCIEMTGNGIAFFASFQHKGFTWKKFFDTLRGHVMDGCAVNICRVDFAFDDYKGLLNMDTIEQCVKQHDYVSRFRSASKKDKDNDNVTDEISSDTDYNAFGIAKTIYFGNKKSNCFCRFYNKLLEQRKKHSKNEKKLDELDKIKLPLH